MAARGPGPTGTTPQEVKLHATDAKELGSAHERLTELDRCCQVRGSWSRFPMGYGDLMDSYG